MTESMMLEEAEFFSSVPRNGVMNAAQVEAFLLERKELIGIPIWQNGTRTNQFRLQWPVLCGGISSTYIQIRHQSEAQFYEFTIMLMIPPPVYRLDMGVDLEHANRRAVPRRIIGPHVHPWHLNAPARGTALPAMLPEAVAYAGPESPTEALEWFCEKTHIVMNGLSLPSLRMPETLL